jgi:hypothetical protein
VKTTPKPSQIAILVGGLVVFIFSFLDFFKSSFGDEGFSAWSGDLLFPLTAFPALLALIVVGLTAAVLFADVDLPDAVLSFNWRQISFILAFTIVLVLFGLIISAPTGSDIGIGLIISLLGGLALLAGTVMELLGIEAGGRTGSGAQTPGGPTTPF